MLLLVHLESRLSQAPMMQRMSEIHVEDNEDDGIDEKYAI